LTVLIVKKLFIGQKKGPLIKALCFLYTKANSREWRTCWFCVLKWV